VSVDPNSGAVTLWDSKYRARGGTLEQSPTFSDPTTRGSALGEALGLVRETSLLSPQVKQQAEMALRVGNFTTNTVGSGGLRNSVQVRYCNGVRC
jgi:filamentous hemagglutinin